jgi:uncharacterized protein YjiS (DUF1127 family)
MEAGNLIQQPIPRRAGYALVEVLVELLVTGWQTAAGWMIAYAAARRRRQARLELQHLSDRFLKDIGLERSQIDRLFR